MGIWHSDKYTRVSESMKLAGVAGACEGVHYAGQGGWRSNFL